MKELDEYAIAILVLTVLTCTAGVSMIVVCSLFCFKNRGNLSDAFKLNQHRHHSNPSSIVINGNKRHSVASTSNAIDVFKDDSDMLKGLVHLLELIENRDKIKIWKGMYTGTIVCVKTFKPTLSDLWANERYLYSLQSTSSSEYIQQYIGSQQKTRISLYILTEYHPLGSLCSYLQNNSVTMFQALNITHSVSSGLAHLHSNRYLNKESLLKKIPIAHRDIKSANILVKNIHGHCVIGDFSQAIILNPNATKRSLMNLNRKRKYMGTLQYMSPEALEGRMNLTDSEAFKQIDVYALSLVIWEVCNRCAIEEVQSYQLPYSDAVGEAPTLESMHRVAVVEKQRPKLLDLWDAHKITKKLKKIMTESWDEDPEARLTAANIAGQLQELFDSIPTGIEEDQGAGGEIDDHQTPRDIIDVGQHTQHSEIVISPSESSQ